MRISGHAMNTQASTVLAVGLIAIPVAAATAHPGAAVTGQPVASRTAPAVRSARIPSLAISVTDGQAAATTGDRLTYTVSVRDTGTVAAPHLKIDSIDRFEPAEMLAQASDLQGHRRAGIEWTQRERLGGLRRRGFTRSKQLADVAPDAVGHEEDD